MTVFDILAKRNADKLRAVGADGASVRYHLRMNGGVVGVIDTFELFDGVSLMFNASLGERPNGAMSSPASCRLTGAYAGGSNSRPRTDGRFA